MTETEVNNIFDASSLSPLPRYHCWGMGTVVLSRGLISGALKPGEFDKLGLHPLDFGPLPLGKFEYRRYHDSTLPLKSVPWGYLVNFDNNVHYAKNDMFANEFAIKTGADKYVPWGLTNSEQVTEAYIKDALLGGYNQGLWPWQQIGIKDIPGYRGKAWGLNVPPLAQKIFNLRIGQTPPGQTP